MVGVATTGHAGTLAEQLEPGAPEDGGLFGAPTRRGLVEYPGCRTGERADANREKDDPDNELGERAAGACRCDAHDTARTRRGGPAQGMAHGPKLSSLGTGTSSVHFARNHGHSPVDDAHDHGKR